MCIRDRVNAGHTCIKGRYAFGFYDHPDRLKTPLIKKNGKFEEASWDEAYDFIKKEMNLEFHHKLLHIFHN